MRTPVSCKFNHSSTFRDSSRRCRLLLKICEGEDSGHQSPHKESTFKMARMWIQGSNARHRTVLLSPGGTGGDRGSVMFHESKKCLGGITMNKSDVLVLQKSSIQTWTGRQKLYVIILVALKLGMNVSPFSHKKLYQLAWLPLTSNKVKGSKRFDAIKKPPILPGNS